MMSLTIRLNCSTRFDKVPFFEILTHVKGKYDCYTQHRHRDMLNKVVAYDLSKLQDHISSLPDRILQTGLDQIGFGLKNRVSQIVSRSLYQGTGMCPQPTLAFIFAALALDTKLKEIG